MSFAYSKSKKICLMSTKGMTMSSGWNYYEKDQDTVPLHLRTDPRTGPKKKKKEAPFNPTEQPEAVAMEIKVKQKSAEAKTDMMQAKAKEAADALKTKELKAKGASGVAAAMTAEKKELSQMENKFTKEEQEKFQKVSTKKKLEYAE